MFTEPEKHLIIALTKTRLVANSFNEDELIDVATGENGEHRSFRGYNVVICEQDNVDEMQ